MKWSNSHPSIQFVLKSDLSYFQERPSGVDRKDSFKDELQGRIKVERSPKTPREPDAKGHDRAARGIASTAATYGLAVGMHAHACSPCASAQLVVR